MCVHQAIAAMLLTILKVAASNLGLDIYLFTNDIPLCFIHLYWLFRTSSKTTAVYCKTISCLHFFNTWFRASWFNVNKSTTRCNSMQTFIHCHVTLHVSGVTHPSSGVLKTVSATSGVCHGNGTVTYFHRGLIRTGVRACDPLTPVRIRPRWKEVTVPLPWHTPEVADTVFSTPDDRCVTPETCRVTWQWINVCILLHRVGPLLTLNHDARNRVFKIKIR